MPLAQPLAELRQNLEAQIRENQLPEVLNALLKLVPEGSETQRIVSALIARLNAANKERYRNTISSEEYQRRVDQVSADFFDLLAGLTEGDFEEKPASDKATAGKLGKLGNVLYRVPQIMPIQKPVRCTIRVSVDEDVILENIVLDEHVHVKPRVEISDVMRAELVDAAGGVFKITALNAPNQLVRDTGYTEWNFSVTPLREGVHQLLVKVSIMEIVPGHSEPILRDVSVMETVTIVTEDSTVLPGLPAEASAKAGEFKLSGQSFAFQSTATAQGEFQVNYLKSVDSPAESPSPSSNRGLRAPSPKARPSKKTTSPSSNRGLRALALFLAFIILAPAATWAVSPKLDRELFLATLQTNLSGDTAPLDGFIQDHRQDPAARPFLDKAYFRKADKTDSLTDLRVYQREFGTDGKYRLSVLQKVEAHENSAVESIINQPNALKIRQFVAKFPESERLPELKQAAEARAENRTELLTALENAYVSSVQAQPTETKVAAYLRDFPKQERLNEIAEAVAAKPELLAKTRLGIEDAITRKVEAATTADQVRQVLPALESIGNSAATAKIEQIVAQKSPQIKKELRQQMRQSSERVNQREKADADLKPVPKPSPKDPLQNGLLEGSKLPESSNPSEQQGTPVETRNRRSGLEMVSVEGGSYLMGSPESEKDREKDECQHELSVKTFSMGKYELTQADWFEVMGTKPSNFEDCDECPVENVTWNDVQDFLKALNKKHPGKNYRLPSEAEWEYAASGGIKGGGYLYAGSNDLKKVAWYIGNSGSKTHRVGELAANKLGIYDMSGNVWEWCQDKYGPYPCNDRNEQDNSIRVRRGGSWINDPENCRVALRSNLYPYYRNLNLGFRVVRGY